MGGQDRLLVQAVTVISMSWFCRFARNLALEPAECETLTRWARGCLQDLERRPRSGLGWEALAELEERLLRPRTQSVGSARGALVLHYLERVLGAERKPLDQLWDWLIALGNLSEPGSVPDEALGDPGISVATDEFRRRCPEGLKGLLAPHRLDEGDDWDRGHRLVWEPRYRLETRHVWEGHHCPLVSALLLHDLPPGLTNGEMVQKLSDVAVGRRTGLRTRLVDWQVIRDELGL